MVDVLTSGWAIDGPVKTPVTDARRLVYGLSGDAHGVASAADMVVSPTSPPGGAVQVSPGSALIKSRYANGETYLASVNEALTVATSPTPSDQGRTDLVVMEVLDPWAQNSAVPVPADPETFEFFRVHVIEGVAANTTAKHLHQVPGYENRTGVVLARLNLPQNRADVQAGFITRVAVPHTPKRDEAVFARPRVAADDSPQNHLTGTLVNGGEFFPGGGGYANQFQVLIPEWVTRMVIDAAWMSVYYGASRNPFGRYWMEFGDEYRAHTWPNKQQYEFTTQQFSFNAPSTTDEKTANWLLMDEVFIPPKLRGKLVTFVFKAAIQNTPGANHTWMNASSGLGCRLTFAERSIGSDLL